MGFSLLLFFFSLALCWLATLHLARTEKETLFGFAVGLLVSIGAAVFGAGVLSLPGLIIFFFAMKRAPHLQKRVKKSTNMWKPTPSQAPTLINALKEGWALGWGTPKQEDQDTTVIERAHAENPFKPALLSLSSKNYPTQPPPILSKPQDSLAAPKNTLPFDSKTQATQADGSAV